MNQESAGILQDERPGTSGSLRENSPVVLSSAQIADLNKYMGSVEYYQPLYGLQIAARPLRECRDRADVIARALSPLDGRLRVVDFGASLGYFVFYFADRGAHAEGVDFAFSSVAAATAVRRINGLNCSLHCAELTLEYVRAIPAGKFDAGLLLSVLHHIVHGRGLNYAQQLVAELMQRIPVLILELARRDEEVLFAWRRSQPQDPLELLAACQNIRIEKLGEFATHLSPVARPIWMAVRNDFAAMNGPIAE
jgi:O-antigen chain-terminating methyltransferase